MREGGGREGGEGGGREGGREVGEGVREGEGKRGVGNRRVRGEEKTA